MNNHMPRSDSSVNPFARECCECLNCTAITVLTLAVIGGALTFTFYLIPF